MNTIIFTVVIALLIGFVLGTLLGLFKKIFSVEVDPKVSHVREALALTAEAADMPAAILLLWLL